MKRRRTSLRKGGILLEVLLSIAIFAGAASFVLGALRSAIDAQQRSLAEQQAVDLAASLMAELEVGSLSLSELREGLPRQLGSIENFSESIDDHMSQGLPGWSVDITTQRSEYTGLTLIELTVFRTQPDDGAGAAPGDSTIRYTLRQLVRLREADAQGYEQDPLLEGLPGAEGGSQ